MFNPRRAAEFIGKLMVVLLPILTFLLILGLITELVHREADWTDLIVEWQFWLAVARDMLPGIVAVLAVYALAAQFVQRLYKLESLAEARSLVHRLLFGLFKFGPWMKVEGGTPVDAEGHVLMGVGGPGHLVVYNDSAVLLEKGGRFTQVHGKGFAKLEPFERLYDVIDLRPIRRVYEVKSMSREGIPVACDAEITFQIDNEGHTSTEEIPYPVSEDKVFQAIICKWIREADRPQDRRTMDWAGRVIISETEGSLRTILARHPLDRLIGLASSDTENPRESIRQELEAALRSAVPKLGARILSVELGDIRVQDEVTQQWVEAWKARWQQWATEREALGKAKQVEQVESAKTRAQIMTITTFTAAFRPLLGDKGNVTSKLVLMRLFMVLGRACRDPLSRVYLPQEAVTTLNLLRDMLL